MKILVLGGTRYFGRHAVRALLGRGHEVTICTRGLARDDFGAEVERLKADRTNADSLKAALDGKYFDAVVDDLAYCSCDVRALLETLNCGRYVMTSTTAVYNKHPGTRETDFDPMAEPVEWCLRNAHPYDEIKRSAERALFQAYPELNFAAVRYPFVIGADDYTNRLKFYVAHILSGTPMYIDNIDCEMSFISSSDAGRFLAFMAESDYRGAVNGASAGTVSLAKIIGYVERRTGKLAVISPDGEPAPYNREAEYSIDTTLAESLGFRFSRLNDWIWELIDKYIGCEPGSEA